MKNGKRADITKFQIGDDLLEGEERLESLGNSFKRISIGLNYRNCLVLVDYLIFVYNTYLAAAAN